MQQDHHAPYLALRIKFLQPPTEPSQPLQPPILTARVAFLNSPAHAVLQGCNFPTRATSGPNSGGHAAHAKTSSAHHVLVLSFCLPKGVVVGRRHAISRISGRLGGLETRVGAAIATGKGRSFTMVLQGAAARCRCWLAGWDSWKPDEEAVATMRPTCCLRPPRGGLSGAILVTMGQNGVGGFGWCTPSLYLSFLTVRRLSQLASPRDS